MITYSTRIWLHDCSPLEHTQLVIIQLVALRRLQHYTFHRGDLYGTAAYPTDTI